MQAGERIGIAIGIARSRYASGMFACGKKGTGQFGKVVSFMKYPE